MCVAYLSDLSERGFSFFTEKKFRVPIRFSEESQLSVAVELRYQDYSAESVRKILPLLWGINVRTSTHKYLKN